MDNTLKIFVFAISVFVGTYAAPGNLTPPVIDSGNSQSIQLPEAVMSDNEESISTFETFDKEGVVAHQLAIQEEIAAVQATGTTGNCEPEVGVYFYQSGSQSNAHYMQIQAVHSWEECGLICFKDPLNKGCAYWTWTYDTWDSTRSSCKLYGANVEKRTGSSGSFMSVNGEAGCFSGCIKFPST